MKMKLWKIIFIPFVVIIGIIIAILVYANVNKIDLNISEFYIIVAGMLVSSIFTLVGLYFTALENRDARKERNLSLVASFSAQLTALKDKERNLKSQKDCETYAQNYVDLMDQIAYLYLNGSLPNEVADFFENELSYALTMIEWMNKFKIEKKLIVIDTENIQKIEDKENEFKFHFAKNGEQPVNSTLEVMSGKFEQKKITLTVDKKILEVLDYDHMPDEKKIELNRVLSISKDTPINEQFQIDKQYPWTSLVQRCINKNIIPFGMDQQLPKTMMDYDSLPSDERDKIMEIINQYSTQITGLKIKEESLTTKNDCETYAGNFVDLMDQIAFLYEKNTFPVDINEYFENEFEYALTMILWLENNKVACELRNNIEKFHPRKKKAKYTWADLIAQYDEDVNHKEQKGEMKRRAYTWNSLMKWCKNKMEPLENNPLPIPMQEYNQLPDEEMDRTLELIKSYGNKLSELTQKEKDLKDDTNTEKEDLACDLYANSYIDLMDGIAFLYHTKALPKKVAKYFENNFCYALTLNRFLVSTKLAEQKDLPIYLKINDMQKKVENMTCEDWLKKDVSKKWINNHLNDQWIRDNLTLEDMKKWGEDHLTEAEINNQESQNMSDDQILDYNHNKWKSETLSNLTPHLTIGDQYTWTDFMMWCKENNLTPYGDDQLPPIMREKLSKEKVVT